MSVSSPTRQPVNIKPAEEEASAPFSAASPPQASEVSPLHVHTLESLCVELVSGRAVIIDDVGTRFEFPDTETRSLFQWYRKNPSKWSQRVQKADVDALVDSLTRVPTAIPAAQTVAATNTSRVVHLHSIRVHRFAGLHRYGTEAHPPDDFCFTFDRRLTVIEGANGSGKTSLLNAIIWGLTGRILRSHRAPESAEQPSWVQLAEQGDEVSDAKHEIGAITPLPPAEMLRSLGSASVPLDTWVELSFTDDSGVPVGKLRRTLERTARGRIRTIEQVDPALTLDPISREIGTTMPGLIQHIQLQKPSELGKAVASLTGLKPLQDLARHAKRSREYLSTDLAKACQEEIAQIDERYSRLNDELAQLLSLHPEISPPDCLPKEPSDPTVLKALTVLTLHFETLQMNGLKECTLILGSTFDPRDPSARNKLIASVAPALGHLDTENLGRLASAARLSTLGKMKPEEIGRAERLLASLRAQAQELSELAKEPMRSSRQRLYARMAGWLKEMPFAERDLDHCPVCRTSLANRIDSVTGRQIVVHLQDCLDGTDKSHLEKTAKEWEVDALSRLRSELPLALRNEMDLDLPQHPLDLVTRAISVELFEAAVFAGPLSLLRGSAEALCKAEGERAPKLVEPAVKPLPAIFANSQVLNSGLHRIDRALAFARWRRDHVPYLREALGRLIEYQSPEKTVPGGALANTRLPIATQLRALNVVIQSNTPLIEALNKVKRLMDMVYERNKISERIACYSRAASAIEPIVRLGDVAQQVVSQLTTRLMDATKEWKGRLYSASIMGAPNAATAQVQPDGSLLIEAESGGVIAPAQDVSNASDLRATLLGFLLAFRAYMLENRGGLSLLLLDDVHELFDRHNRRKLANAISQLAQAGSRILVTTNDTNFGRQISASATEFGPEFTMRRQIHTLSGIRDCICLGEFAEEVQRKRIAFRTNENDHQKARDYLKDVRIYIENRLLNFFDVSTPGLPDRPTLSQLVDALRSRRSMGREPFIGPVWTALLDDTAIAHSSQFIKFVNAVHHGQEAEVMYTDVVELADECDRVVSLVDAAQEDYERWMRRDRRPLTLEALPDPPPPISVSKLDVPLISDLAAFSSDRAVLEAAETGDRLVAQMVQNCAMYVIRNYNFGFAAPIYSRILVDPTAADVSDNRLVVALHREKIYARRLLRDRQPTSVITLGSEAENPLKRPPSLVLPTAEVRILKAVGVLFDNRPPVTSSKEEAVLVLDEPFPDNVELAFRVSGNSALPLALPNQIVLGGPCVTPRTLDRHKGAILAIDTSEGSFLKRVGDALPSVPHVRLFHSIGGQGESVVLRTEDVEDAPIFLSLPVIRAARLVLGVLYGRH